MDEVKGVCVYTLVEFEVCDRLPFVRRNEPLVLFPSTRQIDDEFVLVVVQRGEDGAQAVHAED